MQAVHDEMETIHLYVVKEKHKKPSIVLPLLGALLCLATIVGVTAYSALHPVYVHETLTLPAHFLPLQTLRITQAIIPTGIQTSPATTAHGMLTLTNGSVITQQLPQGMLFSGNGVEVITDAAVLVPSGDATSFGSATVSAHTLVSGKRGNLPALSINQVYGTSLFIRNLSPFTGGKESYSVQIVTSQDRQTALGIARAFLAAQKARTQAILANPCTESIQAIHAVTLTWTCQFVAYPHLRGMKITAVRLRGTKLLVDVVFVAPPISVRRR